jgi:hypothetical protein
MLYEFLLFGHKAPPLICRLYQGEYAESIYIFWDSFRVINIDMNNEIEKIIRGDGEDADNAFGEWYSEQRRSGGKLTKSDHTKMQEIRDRRKERLSAQKAALSNEKSKNLKEHFKNRILNEAYRKPRFGDGIRSRVLAAILGTSAGAMAGHDAQSRTNPVIPPVYSSGIGHTEAPLTQRTPIAGDRDEWSRKAMFNVMHDAERSIDKQGLEYPRINRITDRNIKPGVYGALGGAGAYLAALINKLRPSSNRPALRRQRGDIYGNQGARQGRPPIEPDPSFTPNRGGSEVTHTTLPDPMMSRGGLRGTSEVTHTTIPDPRYRRPVIRDQRPSNLPPAYADEVSEPRPMGQGSAEQPTTQPSTSSEVAKSILGDFGMPALPTSSASVPSSWFPRSDSPPTTTTPTINPTVSDEPTSPTRTPAAGTGSAGQPSTPTETPDKPTEELPGVAGEPTMRDVIKQALMRKLTGGRGGKGRSGKRPSV